MRYGFLAGAGLSVLLAGSALAAVNATATTDLNIRSGPGPGFEVVGLIGANQTASVGGCVEGGAWCQVNYNGVQGWAYSAYLAASAGGNQVMLNQPTPAVEVPTVTYDGPSAAVPGAVGGAIVGAVVGGPIGAVAGAAIGGAAGAAIDPPDQVVTYVSNNPVEPVYLDGEVVVGATLPAAVPVTPIPEYEYAYVYVNGVPALVEPGSRRVVYVVR